MERLKNIMNILLGYLTAIFLIVMTGLVLWQVFTRYILGNPSMFTEEIVRIFLIWTSFLGATYAFGKRQHMSLVFLKEKLKGKSKKILCASIDFIILLVAIILLIKGGFKFAFSSMSIRTPILGISKGWVYMIGPISGILILIYQLINIWEDLNVIDETKI